MSDIRSSRPRGSQTAETWRLRATVVALFLGAAFIIFMTDQILTERYTDTTRTQAELELAGNSAAVKGEIRRNEFIPLVLSRDPIFIGGLASTEFSQIVPRLIEFREEIDAERLLLLDRDGRTVASTDRSEIGANYRQEPFVVAALRSNDTVFTTLKNELGVTEFYHSRKIEREGRVLGVAVVEVDLARFERRWRQFRSTVIVTDAEQEIILSTRPSWKGKNKDEALAAEPTGNAIERALQASPDWLRSREGDRIGGALHMREQTKVNFQGWSMVSFTPYGSVRDRVNVVLAFEVMSFALLIAVLFYVLTRQAERRSALFQQESAELRSLNALLQHEISERQKAEKNLEVAEQSLAQSSKLAVLGEMAAAVSHELNQPLAAMKTYLAGSKLLLQRRRTDEAVSSFQRINDLIDRMGAITRQLKSYAHKGDEAASHFDLCDAVESSIAIMEPQLRQRGVRIGHSRPDHPVWVRGDRLRLEQVVINLLRNAVDATQDRETPQIDVILTVGRTATLTVRDNGTGIRDLDSLFEPFYTTKAPGDGVGLGLAISSGIVAEMGGRLTARNRSEAGAVFEMQVPVDDSDTVAAE